MNKTTVLLTTGLIILLLIGGFQLYNSPELANEPPEVVLTHNGEALNQALGVICWGNCQELSKEKDRLIDLGSSQSMNFSVNELPQEALVEFELDGRPPDRWGYRVNSVSTEDNSASGHTDTFEDDTSTFVLPSTSHTDFSNIVFVAEWFDEDELQGAIEIAFSVDYR